MLQPLKRLWSAFSALEAKQLEIMSQMSSFEGLFHRISYKRISSVCVLQGFVVLLKSLDSPCSDG